VAFAQASDATAGSSPGDEPWLVWHTHDFFTSCDGNCAFGIYGGRQVTTNMTRVFFLRDPVAPWNDHVGKAGIVSGSFSRRIASLLGVLDFEAELGAGQRFGDMHATEVWAAIDFRWTYFPWNDYVKTTFAIVEGGNYASRIDPEELRLSSTGKGSNFLNFCSPELTLALPALPNDELVLRYHHRSGIFGTINDVWSGASFAEVGYRHRF
jgi:hypothetical protein